MSLTVQMLAPPSVTGALMVLVKLLLTVMPLLIVSPAPPLALSAKSAARVKKIELTLRLTVSTTLVVPPVPKTTVAPLTGTAPESQLSGSDQLPVAAEFVQVTMGETMNVLVAEVAVSGTGVLLSVTVA